MSKKICLSAIALGFLGLVFSSSSNQDLVLATTECGSPLIEVCVNNSVEPPYINGSTSTTGGGKSFVNMLSVTI